MLVGAHRDSHFLLHFSGSLSQASYLVVLFRIRPDGSMANSARLWHPQEPCTVRTATISTTQAAKLWKLLVYTV